MFLRIDKLGVELPAFTKYDPTAAAAPLEVVQGHPARADAPEGTPNQAGFAPNHEPSEIFDIAMKLMKNM